MGRHQSEFFTALLTGVLSLVLLTSCKSAEADLEGAVATAIKVSLEEWVGAEVLDEAQGEVLWICLGHKSELDVAAVANKLRHTSVRVVPESECTSRTVEGDFGMFSAMTNYFAPDGSEAGHLVIPRVDCPSSGMCVVEIDSFGSGDSYRIERKAGEWSATKRWNRWVV